MKTILRFTLIVPLLASLLLVACDPPDNLAEKAALEKRVAELEREKAEMARAAAEAELAQARADLEAQRGELETQRGELAAQRDDFERERIAMQETLEASAPKAVIVDEEPEAAKLAIEVRNVPVEELSRGSHDRLVEVAGKIAAELVRKLDKKNGRPAVVEPLQAVPVAEQDYGVFYANLQHYGTWFQTTDYGYAWQPAVLRTDPDWRPYTRGRWMYSDQGWTWASDEPFGWATYHYGRWARFRGVGWAWVPGEQWAPAWVSWRKSNDYIGWAPLPPETLYDRQYAYDHRVDQIYGVDASWYTFMPARNFGQEVRSVCLPATDSRRIVRVTSNATRISMKNGRVHVSGIDYKWVNSRRGSVAPTCTLAAVDHRGHDHGPIGNRVQGQRMEVYAPKVNAGWNAAVRPGMVSRNLGRVVVERGVGVERSVVERYYQEALRRQELGRQVAASDQGRHALMRRQIALQRQQERTRQAARQYHEQCEREARGRHRDESRLRGEVLRQRQMEEERVRAREARLAEERARVAAEQAALREQMRLEESRRQAGMRAQEAEQKARQEAADKVRRNGRKGDPAHRAEVERQRLAEETAAKAKRDAEIAAMEAEAERLRQRAQRPAQVEQAKRAEMELQKAREARRIADEQARQAAMERQRAADAKRLADEQARRAAAEKAQKAAAEKTRLAAMERQRALAAQKAAAQKAAAEQAKKAAAEQAKRAEMERMKALEAQRLAEEQARKAAAEQARKAAEERAKRAPQRPKGKQPHTRKPQQPKKVVPVAPPNAAKVKRDAEITAMEAEVARLKARAQRPAQVAAYKRAEEALNTLYEARRIAEAAEAKALADEALRKAAEAKKAPGAVKRGNRKK